MLRRCFASNTSLWVANFTGPNEASSEDIVKHDTQRWRSADLTASRLTVGIMLLHEGKICWPTTCHQHRLHDALVGNDHKIEHWLFLELWSRHRGKWMNFAWWDPATCETQVMTSKSLLTLSNGWTHSSLDLLSNKNDFDTVHAWSDGIQLK